MLLKTGLLMCTQVALLSAASPGRGVEDPPAQTAPVPSLGEATSPQATPVPPSGEAASPQAVATPPVQAPPEPAPALPQALPGPKPALPPDAVDVRLYSMSIKDKEADDVLLTFAKTAGVQVAFLSPCVEMLTLSFTKLTMRQVLDLVCEAAGLQYRFMNGVYLVGLPMDIQVRFPTPDEKTLDATYHCRHLDANTLAPVLASMLPPEVKINQGPRYLSPALDSSGDPSGITGEQVRTLGATDISFKVHDIILSGPADLVRRALMFARKFDKPRKQVRINIRIIEVQDNIDRNLGLSWMQSINLASTEQPTTAGGTTVDGIRLGKFSHTPLIVNATLNALEHNGKANTLSNPSLLLMDGERSFILSGQKVLYPKFTGKDAAGLSMYDTSEVKVGIYLQVAVHLGLNNDVLMSIVPQVTNIADFKTYNAGTYPIINTREAQTTVHAYNGEMVVLGGLKQDSATSANDGLPFLRKIPILGRLFSNGRDTKVKSELMIFLTPQIVDDLDHIETMDIQVTQ